jgi:hypothetical protein
MSTIRHTIRLKECSTIKQCSVFEVLSAGVLYLEIVKHSNNFDTLRPITAA